MLIPLRWLLYETSSPPPPPPGPEGGTGGYIDVRKRKKHDISVNPGPQQYKIVMAGNRTLSIPGIEEKLSKSQQINDDEALLMILSNL